MPISRARPALVLVPLLAGVASIAACTEDPFGTTVTGKASPRAATVRKATAPAHGFNDDIAWRGLDEGLREASELQRPLMLLVHTSWCGRCRELKVAFADEELEKASAQFVMVNVDQDEVPRSLQFAPDGAYVPRVLIVDPKTGQVDPDLRNDRRSQTVYYYTPHDDLVGTMKKALSRYGSS